MGFVNKNLQQLSNLIQSMSMSARITSVLLLVAIALSLFYLVGYQIGGGETYVYGGREFSQSELAAMEEALSKAGLNDYEIVGFRMKVPRSNRDEYVRAIAENGATPRMAHEYDGLAPKTNPFMGKESQRLQAKKDKQLKLAQQITQLSGIESAAVETDESETATFPRKIQRTASVTVKAEGTRALTDTEVQAIRNIVAFSEAGMKANEIVVVDGNTKESYVQVDDDPMNSPENNIYARSKRWWEDEFRRKIERRLADYNPNVEVLVELDPTLRYSESAKTLDSAPVAIKSDAQTESFRSVNSAGGGQPGVQTNNPPSGTNTSASVATAEAREEVKDTSKEKVDSVVGGKIAETERAGLIPEKVKVSIGIPRSFYLKLWQTRHPPVDGEEPVAMTDTDLLELETETSKRVEEIVSTLIPKVEKGEDIYKFIVVETDPDIPEEALPEPTMSDHALSWLAGNWQTMGMLLMGFVGLVMLRGMIKSSTPVEPVDEQDDETDEENASSEESKDGTTPTGKDPYADSKLRKRFGTSGRSLKEELTELVEEDLEAAASVLRTWIGDLG